MAQAINGVQMAATDRAQRMVQMLEQRHLQVEMAAAAFAREDQRQSAQVAKSGELGYLYGTYQLSIKDPKGGPAITDTGKVLEVWKKQSDGKWKCIVDTYNSDIPVPAVPAVKK